MNLKEKTVLIIDSGWFCELGPRLARDFGDVLYWSPWQSEFPYSQDAAIGAGLEGVVRVKDYHDALAFADLVVFPSLNDAGLQEHLRSQGKRVWGTGRAEALELDRVLLKDFLKRNGLPVVPYKLVRGVEELKLVMQREDDIIIKLANGYRGDTETFCHSTWEMSAGWYFDLVARLGPLGKRMLFLVEEKIEGFEGGSDQFTVNGQLPSTVMIGYEIKDSCYVSTIKPLYEVAYPIRDVLVALGPEFQRFGMKQLFSTEVRIDKEGNGYFIDLAARFPSPPYGTMMENIENFSEILWYGSEGMLIQPTFRHRYGVELNLTSPWLEQNWQSVQIEGEDRRWVKLHNAMKQGSIYYSRPQFRENNGETGALGSVIALGDDLKQTAKACIERAERVKGLRIEFNPSDLEKAQKTIDEGKSYGISF
jgi:hypothetical protein